MESKVRLTPHTPSFYFKYTLPGRPKIVFEVRDSGILVENLTLTISWFMDRTKKPLVLTKGGSVAKHVKHRKKKCFYHKRGFTQYFHDYNNTHRPLKITLFYYERSILSIDKAHTQAWSWTEAKQMCKCVNGTLPTFRSRNEVEELVVNSHHETDGTLIFLKKDWKVHIYIYICTTISWPAKVFQTGCILLRFIFSLTSPKQERVETSANGNSLFSWTVVIFLTICFNLFCVDVQFLVGAYFTEMSPLLLQVTSSGIAVRDVPFTYEQWTVASAVETVLFKETKTVYPSSRVGHSHVYLIPEPALKYHQGLVENERHSNNYVFLYATILKTKVNVLKSTLENTRITIASKHQDTKNSTMSKVSYVSQLDNCPALLLVNLANPQWISINCSAKLSASVVCSTENMITMPKNKMKVFDTSQFCPVGLLLETNECYSFEWITAHDARGLSCFQNVTIFKSIFVAVSAKTIPQIFLNFNFVMQPKRYKNQIDFDKKSIDNMTQMAFL